MNSLRLGIEKIFKGAVKSFYRFPAAIVSALVISLVAIVKISMEWEVQETYNLLFDSIQISFALGAIFSMAAVALDEIKVDKEKNFFLWANIAGVLLASVSFLLLYFYGGGIPEGKVVYLSAIAMARVSVAIFASGLAFVYISSKAKSIDSFSDSFFISQKAFIVSAIYGLVIMAGVSGVLGAFQALVYRNMDVKIYGYLGVAVGFLTFTLFLGYFPSFRQGEDIDEINSVKEQPKFIYVLFESILTPIMMALTLVLLIWSVRVVLQGMDVSFNRLSSIASSYVIVGIWLHMMLAKHESKLAEFYKKAYPFAGILILIFEAWALFVQLNKFGFKTAEYSFLMIWIFASISVFLLIFLKEKAYRKIAITAVVVAIVWVLPILGYQDITFNSQVKRLEEILIQQGILIDNKILAKDKGLEYTKRGEITDAVDFITSSEKTNTPDWFKKDLSDEKVFKDTFGFEKTYGVYEEETEYSSSNFRLQTDVIDISDYSLGLNIDLNEEMDAVKSFKGEKGEYTIEIKNNSKGIPDIKVKLEDKLVIQKDLEEYLSELLSKYPLEENREKELAFEDMNLVLEGEDLAVLLVFRNIDVFSDKIQDRTDYYVNFHGIYIKYK